MSETQAKKQNSDPLGSFPVKKAQLEASLSVFNGSTLRTGLNGVKDISMTKLGTGIFVTRKPAGNDAQEVTHFVPMAKVKYLEV